MESFKINGLAFSVLAIVYNGIAHDAAAFPLHGSVHAAVVALLSATFMYQSAYIQTHRSAV